jgi:2-polyprenyl-3-methyl-5-hydroxy-6-metoxy-1,4-benzoquinol methylase
MATYKLPTKLVDREQFVLDMCKEKNVLHLGCADFPYTDESIKSGKWLHAKITSVASSCLGVDLDKESIEKLKNQYGVDNIVEGNAEALNKCSDQKFDVIVAGEIIEHLNNPGMFLDSARDMLSPGGRLVITTTNAYCFRRFLRVLFSIESIHPDHTYYFSHTTLHTLAKRFGYSLSDASCYRLPNKTPFLPYLVERVATIFSSNLGEGIIQVYAKD